MPTYEYACTACGHRLEAVQKFSDDPLTECPECHGALRKVYGAVGIVLKGSGFYKTDSRAAAGASNGKSAKGSDKGDKDKDKGKEKESTSTATSTSTSESSSPKSDGGSKDAKPAAAAAT